MKLSNIAQAVGFSHLLGRDRPINVSANIRADDGDGDDDAMRGKKSRAKSKAKAEETENENDENGKKGKSAKAEEEEEEDETERREKPDGRKSKKAKAEGREEEEEEDGDRREEKAHARGVRAGIRAERDRCREIFASDAAAGRPDVAAHLAFNTSMSAEEAIGTLEALGTDSARSSHVSLDQRMEGVRTPNPGAGDVAPPDASTPRGMVANMTALYDNVMGRSRQ